MSAIAIIMALRCCPRAEVVWSALKGNASGCGAFKGPHHKESSLPQKALGPGLNKTEGSSPLL